jgi:23S rRNA (guanosine2251-2'-O)-methyltransferase
VTRTPAPRTRAGLPPDVRVVVGIQPVREAIRVHGTRVERVLVQRPASPRLEALARWAADQGVVLERVARSDIDKWSGGVHHQGALALAPPLGLHDLETIDLDDDALVLLLDGITDPQNFGAILRSAVALGATAVVWGEHHAAPLSAATFRASAGAVEHARLCRVPSLRGAVEGLIARGVEVVALELGAAPLDAIDLCRPVAIVVGAEDEGVGRSVRKACSARGGLRTSTQFDALNASVAAALALYEVRRQRAQRRGS